MTFAQRKFPVDMAGFAINVHFLLERNKDAARAMPYKAGYEEDLFLQSLNLSLADISPLASNCTEVLVWHTKTLKEKVPSLSQGSHHSHTQLQSLINNLQLNGMAALKSSSSKQLKTCYDLLKCKH